MKYSKFKLRPSEGLSHAHFWDYFLIYHVKIKAFILIGYRPLPFKLIAVHAVEKENSADNSSSSTKKKKIQNKKLCTMITKYKKPMRFFKMGNSKNIFKILYHT